MNKKIKWLSIAICVLCTSMLIFSGFADAALEMPTIHEGDYWNYELSGGYGTWSYQGTAHNEMIGDTTITVNGESYEVWEGEMTMEYSGENYTTIYEGKWYIRKSDFATVKSTAYMNSTYFGESSSSYSETIHKPVQPDMDFPINVGDTWEIHRENQVTDETGTHTAQEDTYYECIEKEDVATDAGTFSCYVIKQGNTVNEQNNYTISYYSNEVGGAFVKMVTYTNAVLTMTFTLTSYEYQGKNGDDGIPGFEMVLFIGAIGLTLILLRKRKFNL